jgi:serine/threonine-protein kinase
MEPSTRTPAGDQYSLGCMLDCCLTGRVPFPEGSAVEKMMAHQTKEPDLILDFAPETPEGLCDVISKLMAKNPDERYPSCEDVAQILEQYCGDLELTVSTTTRQVNQAKASFGGSNRGGMMTATAQAAVATPAPVQRTPAAARQSLGLGGGGGMTGRASNAAFGGGGGVNGGGVAATPLPNAPKKTTGLVPSRASFQLPDIDDMGGSPFAGNGQAPMGGKASGQGSSQLPADPFKDPGTATVQTAPAEKQLGTLGMMLASLLLGSLAFLAFKLLTTPPAQ